MRYYLKDPEHQAVTGPFEIEEIEAKLKAWELSAGTLATGDIDQGLARVRHFPPEDWMPIKSIPGLGKELTVFGPLPAKLAVVAGKVFLLIMKVLLAFLLVGFLLILLLAAMCHR